MSTYITLNTIQKIAQMVGLDLLSITDTTELIEDIAMLADWQNKGFAAEMGYMKRDAALLGSPLNLLIDGKSIISFAIKYDSSVHEQLPKGYARVARYAWGKDYHLIFKNRLNNFIEKIKEIHTAPINYRIMSDSIPLLERALAKRGGAGFVGKNSMLIAPKLGSNFLIGEVILNLEIKETFPLLRSTGSCKTCTKCITNCPTNAIVEPMVIDARKCISYLTIEKKGIHSYQEREQLGEWIFGCDICQDVCPFNHKKGAGDGAFNSSEGSGSKIDLKSLFRITSEKEFKGKFTDSPLLRPKRAGLIRNGLTVAANTKADSLIDDIKSLALTDSHPLIRATAIWSYLKLMENNISKDLKDKFELDSAPEVISELKLWRDSYG